MKTAPPGQEQIPLRHLKKRKKMMSLRNWFKGVPIRNLFHHKSHLLELMSQSFVTFLYQLQPGKSKKHLIFWVSPCQRLPRLVLQGALPTTHELCGDGGYLNALQPYLENEWQAPCNSNAAPWAPP